jgi:hypothetical protein
VGLGVADLEAYLGVADLANERAVMLLEASKQACESVVKPLPEGCEWIILDVAANAYSSPPGPGGAASVGPFSGQVAPGGVFLSKRQVDALRRLAGRDTAGAFTIDTTPAATRNGRGRRAIGAEGR